MYVDLHSLSPLSEAETMPLLTEIELLHDYPGVPAGTLVVRYIEKRDGALLCCLENGKALFLPDSAHRLLRAWRGRRAQEPGADRVAELAAKREPSDSAKAPRPEATAAAGSDA